MSEDPPPALAQGGIISRNVYTVEWASPEWWTAVSASLDRHVLKIAGYIILYFCVSVVVVLVHVVVI